MLLGPHLQPRLPMQAINELLSHPHPCRLSSLRAPELFRTSSCKMRSSRLRSATNCFNFRFSSSNCLKRRNPPTPATKMHLKCFAAVSSCSGRCDVLSRNALHWKRRDLVLRHGHESRRLTSRPGVFAFLPLCEPVTRQRDRSSKVRIGLSLRSSADVVRRLRAATRSSPLASRSSPSGSHSSLSNGPREPFRPYGR
jgi:hypothetical protein